VRRGEDWSARTRRLLLCAITVGVSARVGTAQVPAMSPADSASRLSVYVVTLGQGDQLWERYGHNALWIHDPARGTDRTYNWGIFDASGPQFIIRFVRGRMRYWMESVEVERLMAFYRTADRSITIQRLALSPAQARALQEFAEWNAREENKFYWYDYFRDNCSTRLRDAVDRALEGGLRRVTENVTTSNTYRSESIRLMEGMPLTQAGIELGLGPLTDRRLNAWEEMFVPMRMRDRLREVRIHSPDGALIPLVAEERQLYVSRRPAELREAPSLLLRYATIGLIAGAIILAFGLLAVFAWRPPFGLVASLWAAATGIAGLLLLFLWLGTHHLFAYRNENLFHTSPIALALAIAAPLALYRPHLQRFAWRVAAVVVVSSLLGVVLKVVPGFVQDNLPIAALVLPGHLALAWTLRRLERASSARRVTASAP
jgi:hypothetical protein